MATKTKRDLEVILTQKEADRKALAEQLKAIDEDIQSLRRSIEMVMEWESAADSGTLPAKELRNTMVEILQQVGQGLHYGEIHELLVKRGITVPGKDPRRNVGAHLSNDDRFEKLGEGLWGLKSWAGPDKPAKIWQLMDNSTRLRGGETA